MKRESLEDRVDFQRGYVSNRSGSSAQSQHSPAWSHKRKGDGERHPDRAESQTVRETASVARQRRGAGRRGQVLLSTQTLKCLMRGMSLRVPGCGDQDETRPAKWDDAMSSVPCRSSQLMACQITQLTCAWNLQGAKWNALSLWPFLDPSPGEPAAFPVLPSRYITHICKATEMARGQAARFASKRISECQRSGFWTQFLHNVVNLSQHLRPHP